MSSSIRDLNPPSASIVSVRWAKYVLIGGLAGLLVGISALFVGTVLYGNSIGLAPLECMVMGCVMTLFLSQPSGIAGMTAGAIVGTLAGAVVHHKHHVQPR